MCNVQTYSYTIKNVLHVVDLVKQSKFGYVFTTTPFYFR